MSYVIQHGDTLWAIAQRNHTTVSQLLAANPEFKSDPRYNGGSMIWAGGTVYMPGEHRPGSNPNPPKAVAKAAAAPAAPKPPLVTPEQQLINQLEGMPGQERDAYAALTTLFTAYGLGSLAPKILNFLQNGFGSDTITILLQGSDEYKNRFAGNEARKQAGLQVLTPAEYLSTEASYRQLLQAAGIDPALMNHQQYSEWIGKDISPTEIKSRVDLAVQASVNSDPWVQANLGYFGINAMDSASYFLNDKNPLPVMQKKMNDAQIMAAGNQLGLHVDPGRAAVWDSMGVNYQQAQNAYGKVSDLLPQTAKLAQLYTNQTPYGLNSQAQLEDQFLASDGNAQLATENLSKQETATFSGQGGVGKQSLAQNTPGAPGFS